MFDTAAPRQLVLAELRRRIDTVAAGSDGPVPPPVRSALRRRLELPTTADRATATDRATGVDRATADRAAEVDRATEVDRVMRGPAAPAGGSSALAVAPAAAPVAAPVPAGREVLPVPPPLARAFPGGGLPKGGVVSVVGGHGVTSLLLALLAAPVGAWAAVVGMPGMGFLAAAELGVDLDRLVAIPDPGPDIWQVLSVLADGVDVVVVAPPAGMDLRQAGRLRILGGRLRQRGAVLLVAGRWPGADLVVEVGMDRWTGIVAGHGRLRDRTLTVAVSGRNAAGRTRTAAMTLAGGRSGVSMQPEVAAPARPEWVGAAAVGQ